jgi:hypothetical protein
MTGGGQHARQRAANAAGSTGDNRDRRGRHARDTAPTNMEASYDMSAPFV